ncbi:alpha/beta hydrolase [Propionibacteriaceae bacterium G1746]
MSTTHDEVHFLHADDGVALTLVRVRGAVEAHRGPVLLLHGAGMRAEMFRPPMPHTFVGALLDDGWDVWLVNWRGSLDLDPLPWTVDDVALHDVPVVVRHVLDQTGAGHVAVVAHCAGAMAASVAVVAGLVPEVSVLVTSGVTLHPVMAPFARLKLHTLRPWLSGHEPYIDAAWGDGPERLVPTITRTAVRWWHTECDNPTCNMASFALGSGRPSSWLHENLNPATHAWLAHEFGRIPMSFYHQLAVSERAHQLVTVTGPADLPTRMADQAPRTTARLALFGGLSNRSFLPESQRMSHSWLQKHRPGKDTLHLLKGYSHTDLFIGKYAYADVFPRMLAELRKE